MQEISSKLVLVVCVLAYLYAFDESLYGSGIESPSKSPVNKLAEGDAYLAAEEYDKAIGAYADSASSSDKKIADEAIPKLVTALTAKRRDAEGIKWPVTQWLRNYLAEIFIIGISILIIWVLLNWWSCWFYSDPWKCPWNLKMRTVWTQDLPTDIFLEEFKATTGEIAELGESLRGAPFANRLNNPVLNQDRLLMTLSLTDVLQEEKLAIQGIDVGWMHKLYSRAVDHLSWVLEIHVVKLDVIYAYATLKIRSRVKKIWRIPRPGHQPPTNVRDAARKLAFEVFSKGWIRT